jgi:hypothetical protein
MPKSTKSTETKHSLVEQTRQFRETMDAVRDRPDLVGPLRTPPLRRREVIAHRLAGDDHAVLTISGGRNGYRREPCETCPWRLDAVGEFPAEAFRHSAGCGIDASLLPWRTDPLAAAAMMESAENIFACHSSGAEKPATCAGYILKGDQAIGWRIAVTKGSFDPKQVSDGGHLLHSNYRAMAEANGVDENDLVLMACPR